METRPVYKMAEELGIEQWEHDGLAALVGPLSRDELGMNMRMPGLRASSHPCGTAGCIGGWVHYRKARKGNGISMAKATHELYFPHRNAAYGATAPQAARAIVNFLVTGDPQWDVVMAGDT